MKALKPIATRIVTTLVTLLLLALPWGVNGCAGAVGGLVALSGQHVDREREMTGYEEFARSFATHHPVLEWAALLGFVVALGFFGSRAKHLVSLLCGLAALPIVLFLTMNVWLDVVLILDPMRWPAPACALTMTVLCFDCCMAVSRTIVSWIVEKRRAALAKMQQ
ncbi:MAG TPA: hypothetical protein VGH28_02840 [Polyangiaceae bacterium]|jgi:hypothetical protein